MAGVPLVYLLPMILGPAIAAVTGWFTAYLQYKSQRGVAGTDKLFRLVNEMQEEVTTARQRADANERRIDEFAKRLSVARDVLLQIIEHLPAFPDSEAKQRLTQMVREGLKVV